MKYNKAYYHNEIELIKVNNTELKNKIEKTFLRNRISYFIRWDKESIWQKIVGKKNNEHCKICINDWDRELALDVLKELEEDIKKQGELLCKRTESTLQDAYLHKEQ